jgi:hypothetical protein
MFPFILNENENNWQYYVSLVCIKITENGKEDNRNAFEQSKGLRSFNVFIWITCIIDT